MNALSAIAAALTPDERASILGGFLDRNPHWTGAGVDDVLDALMDCDAHLDVTEPWWEEHGTRIDPPFDSRWGIALMARVRLAPGRAPTYDEVADLVARAVVAGA